MPIRRQVRAETVETTRGTFTVHVSDLYPESGPWPETQAQAEQIGIAHAFAQAALTVHVANAGGLTDACQSMASGPDYYDLIVQLGGYRGQVPNIRDYRIGVGGSRVLLFQDHWLPFASIPWMLAGSEIASDGQPHTPNKGGARFNQKVLDAAWCSIMIRGLPARSGYPNPDDLAIDLYAPLESLISYASL
jgi:hypothetical protein